MSYPSSSPIWVCAEIETQVRTDQTIHECAHEHRCGKVETCPLSAEFVPITESYRASNTWE